MENSLVIFIVTLAIATLLNILLKRYEIPTIIGYILSGLIISSIFSFDEHTKEILSHLAEFGIVFLMFTIGLEFSLTHLKNMKKEVFVYGGLEVILSGLLFMMLSILIFDLDIKSAIVIGFALSLSSTAIVLKTLNENNEIHSQYGRISFGILPDSLAVLITKGTVSSGFSSLTARSTSAISRGSRLALPLSFRSFGSKASKPPTRYFFSHDLIVSSATFVRLDPGIK